MNEKERGVGRSWVSPYSETALPELLAGPGRADPSGSPGPRRREWSATALCDFGSQQVGIEFRVPTRAFGR